MYKTENSRKYLWIIVTGILISYILSNMLVAGKVNFNRFLAEGQVFEVQDSVLTKSGKTWIYNNEQDCYVIADNDATKRFGKWNEAVAWQCLYIEIDKLEQESVDVVFKALDANNKGTGQVNIINLRNGENYFALNTQIPFQGFKIQILGGNGLCFQLKDVRLIENIPQQKKKAVFFGIIFIGYMLLVFAIMVWQKRNVRSSHESANLPDRALTFLTCACGTAFDVCWDKWGYRRTKKEQKVLRTLLFVFLFIYMLVVYNQGYFWKKSSFPAYALVATVIIAIIAWVSGKRNIKKIQWNNRLAYYWFAFWTVVCVSDFVVPKTPQYIGWQMLFAGGLFFFVWKGQDEQDEIVYNIMRALEILFVPEIIYLMFFRMKYAGVFYNGILKNPEEFCVFSLVMLWVFCVDFYGCIQKRRQGWLLPLLGTGVAINFYFVLQTGEKIGILIAVVMAALMIAMLAAEKRAAKRRYASWLWVSIAVMAIGVGVCHVAIRYLPEITGNNTVFAGEQFYTGMDEMEIEAAKASGIEVYQKLKTERISEKIKIGKTYLREMNLFGHEKAVLKVWDKNKTINNSIIQIMYRYGIIAVLPYILLFTEYIKAIMADFRKKRRCRKATEADLFVAGIVWFWIISGFLWNIENPFVQPLWIIVYLLMGRYIGSKSEY